MALHFMHVSRGALEFMRFYKPSGGVFAQMLLNSSQTLDHVNRTRHVTVLYEYSIEIEKPLGPEIVDTYLDMIV
jgi:hypothetical protein